ncbi:hypothetical protein CNMCM5623_002997 [Aspergillus felis]|uniref:AMP-dependent synthetase/ligase domain-containing protein n=1 Tax=Aspergillus felis TaxID=1287682 RepID=A0A8H6QBF0_9EURO|nr:hypothetical protein CNMCM5623_002997 [Aspergillus felis]
MNGSHSSEPLDGTVVDLFDQWAEKPPERVAAEWQGESLTYGALRDASLHVSRALLLAGVLPRARVLLLTQMSLEMLPAVIGILRVGACYVPMDVAPRSRVRRIEIALSELATPVAVVTKGMACLVTIGQGGATSGAGGRRSGMLAEDLAWIIFTSGTTGKSKGVMVYDRGTYAVCTVQHSKELKDAAEQGVVWTTLSKGATLVMEVAPGPRFEDFARFMHSYTQAFIERATQCFTRMLEPLPASCVLQPPAPKEPPPPEALNLIRLQASPPIIRAALDVSFRRLSVTPGTMIYAAWAIFLHRITSWARVGFSISLSGRTVLWPSAPSVVGPLLCRSLFSTSIAKDATVHNWLATVHKTTLHIIEFDGLTHSLPPSLMADPRTNTSNVLCFLDVPEPSRNWSHKDRQKHYYTLSWYVTQRGEHVATEFEVQLEKVDLYWAKAVAGLPGEILSGLINATDSTRVAELIAAK